jgi:hypothetical protein
MKMRRVYIPLAIGLVSVSVARAQTAFQNLDFEEANLLGYQAGNMVPTTTAFPGWQASEEGSGGTFPLSSVFYDGISIGGAGASIGGNDPSRGTSPLDGNYSAYLFGGGPQQNLFSTSISQTGTVPAGAQAIEFDASVSRAPFVVVLGGTTIAMTPMQSFVDYELWGGNIPAGMAGQTETLTITEPPATGVQPSMLELDDIVFSPNSVTVTPEPSPFVLTAIGGILFALYRRFVKR